MYNRGLAEFERETLSLGPSWEDVWVDVACHCEIYSVMVRSPSACRRRRVRVTRRRSRATTPSPGRCRRILQPEGIHTHTASDHLVRHGHSGRGLLETLLDFDHRISAWVHEQGPGIVFYGFLRTLEFSGDVVFLLPIAAATFLTPREKLTPEVRMFFFNLFMTSILDLIVVSILKRIVKRPRPAYSRGHVRTPQRWSFPSGHSTRALRTATLFALYLPMWKDQSRRIWVPFIADQLKEHVIILQGSMHVAENLLISVIAVVITGWAVATTTSRIILGRHFLCDVLAGSLIGICAAFYAHHHMSIPMEISEYIHSVVHQYFAWIEQSIHNSFHSENFVNETQMRNRTFGLEITLVLNPGE